MFFKPLKKFIYLKYKCTIYYISIHSMHSSGSDNKKDVYPNICHLYEILTGQKKKPDRRQRENNV